MSPQSKWNKAHKDKLREATAKYRSNPDNAERGRAKSREWKKINAAKHCAINAKRKAALLKRLPAWADLAAIESFYAEAARLTTDTGIAHQVDHVIPLQGEFVSGLHVETNLQILTATENMSKGNRFDGETFTT